GDVVLELLIERPYVLRKNEQPVLVHGLLGGDAIIELVPRIPKEGEPDRSPVPSGTELAGARRADVTSLFSRSDELGPQIDSFLTEMREMAKATRESIPELQVAARNWA